MDSQPKRKRGPGRRFTKGNKAGKGKSGPKGSAQIVAAEREVRVMDKRMVFRYMSQHAYMTIGDLKKKYKNPKTPAIEAVICGIIIRLKNSCDMYAFNNFLDRLIGPVTQKIEMTKDNPYESMTDEELLAERERLRKINEQHLRFIENQPRMFGHIESTPEIIDVGPATRLASGGDSSGET